MSRDARREHLAKVRLFSALSKRELALVGRASAVVGVPAGTEIVRQGATGRELYLILDGQATVRRGGRRIATLGPGAYFGELALLDHGPRSATVVADTDAELLVIGQRELLGVIEKVPALARKLLVAMAARLREADTEAFSS